MSEATYVVLVRHGERLDEADREAWRQMRTHDTQYDPPLTAAGWKQSSAAGKLIGQCLRGAARPVSCIYSSPTARTMGTAAAIAKELGMESVAPAYGLNCCAAAKMVGVTSRYFAREPEEKTLKGVKVSCWPPVGDPGEVHKRNRSDTGFVETVRELASAHAPGGVVVMVSHREGIWEVLKHLHMAPTGKYCSTHYLQYDHGSHRVQLWDPQEDGPAPGPTHEAKLTKSLEPAAAPPAAFPLGRVVLELPDGSMRLWQTPGVTGVWVEGGDVSSGEVVEMLSSPQASEGEAGDFVLIRKDTGVEGWTPSKHLKATSTLP